MDNKCDVLFSDEKTDIKIGPRFSKEYLPAPKKLYIAINNPLTQKYAIHELSLNGSNRVRKVLDVEGDYEIGSLSVDPSGEKIATLLKVPDTEEVGEGDSSLTVSLRINNIAD